MESTKGTYMASVSWHYPHAELIALRHQNERASEAETAVVAEGLTLDRLRSRYEITGDNPPWRPVRAFAATPTDYLASPHRIAPGSAPPSFAGRPEGGSQPVYSAARSHYNGND